jgi:hypothetical protein
MIAPKILQPIDTSIDEQIPILFMCVHKRIEVLHSVIIAYSILGRE